MTDAPTMTIGILARAAGIGVETVRFYEREGLIKQPVKSPGSGYRKYAPEIINRINFIKRAKDLGFSLKEIKELLALRVKSPERCGIVRKKAERKIADIEAKLSDLKKIRAALENLVSTCVAESSSSECPILDSLSVE